MRHIELGARTPGKLLFALVDDTDYDLVAQYSWHALHAEYTYYARAQIKQEDSTYKSVLMHRMILGLSEGDVGPDHLNRNGWDNRRANLDMSGVEANMRNRRNWGKSQFRGVNFYPAKPNTRRISDKWRAYYYDGKTAGGNPKQVLLGYFDTEMEAAFARNVAVYKRFGSSIPLDLPLDLVMKLAEDPNTDST